MDKPLKERRKYARFETEAKVYFRINYYLKTKVKFQIIGKKNRHLLLSKKYPALSRDISAEGMGFSSNKKLKKMDRLYLELYLPKQKEPVCMEGQVRWSLPSKNKRSRAYRFDTGVKLANVSDKPVSSSIYYDKKNKIIWSAALESIFGSFRKLIQKQTSKSAKSA